MIDILIAFGIGIVLGYLLKKEQQPPVDSILQNQVLHYQEQIAYYKKLCKTLADENSEFRRKL